MPKKKDEHVVFGNNSLRCLNCGDEHHIDMTNGITLNMMAGLSRGYADDHKHCKPSARGRARFVYETPPEWLASWDTGASSKTIYNFMMHGGNGTRPRYEVAVPHDPADFGRCYRLLKAFPTWRARLDELAVALEAWRPLVDAWPELERLFEEESPSGTCPKLFERIKELVG